MTKLEQYIEKKIIWVEDGEYLAKAGDGEIISLGNVDCSERGISRFLFHSPDPEKW